MVYLTFEEYSEIGGVLDLTAFNRQIGRACGIIDNETFNRLNGENEVSTAVKMCCRDLVEYLNATDSVKVGMVTSRSQSVGGVSESESYQTKSADDMWGDISNILHDYLQSQTTAKGTPLLYRGCGL